MTNEDKMNAIKQFVCDLRIKNKITLLKTDYLSEPSCFAFGEFYNLVMRQLLNTKEGCGAWKELQRTEVLEGAYQFVTTGARGF